MAKKSAFGAILAIGAVAAAGVAAYLKRDELKKAAETVMAKIKAGDTEGIYTYDRDEDGQVDAIVADTNGDEIFDTILLDNDGDGVIDEVAVDETGDGIMDKIGDCVCEASDFAE